MNVFRDQLGAKVELAGVDADRFVEIAKGLAFGYDVHGRVVTIAFASEPWAQVREIVRLGRGPGVASLSYDPTVDAMALQSRASSYYESEEAAPHGADHCLNRAQMTQYSRLID
jgi:hypothetical protein